MIGWNAIGNYVRKITDQGYSVLASKAHPLEECELDNRGIAQEQKMKLEEFRASVGGKASGTGLSY